MSIENRADAAIAQDVMREVRWDLDVEQTALAIEVAHGVVTLRGAVDSWSKRVAVQEAAYRVHGVLEVANDLEVHRATARPRSARGAAQKMRDLGSPRAKSSAGACRTVPERPSPARDVGLQGREPRLAHAVHWDA